METLINFGNPSMNAWSRAGPGFQPFSSVITEVAKADEPPACTLMKVTHSAFPSF